jgi:membrane protein implicated in regulation of membrane protease activity
MQEISPLPPEPKGPLRTILNILAVGSFILMLGVIIVHAGTSFTLGDIGGVLFILFFIVGAVYNYPARIRDAASGYRRCRNNRHRGRKVSSPQKG